VVVLDTTPFYAESGGQAGDTGSIVCDGGEFVVTDTQKQGQQFLHVGHVIQGTFLAGMSVTTHVNSQKRSATAINHSATHLLHAALREILGEHVVQKGSLVNDERLRFDFAHFEAVTDAQLWQLEQRVAGQIRANTEVTTTLTDMTCAQEMGAMALFGEKYGEQVRVLSMGEEAFSVELCGGIHVQRTGDIGQFIIVSEGGISSGVRRIEALTGDAASAYAHENLHQLKQLSTTLKCGRESVLDKSLAQAEKMRLLEKELEKLKSKIAASAGDDLACMAVDVDGIKVVAQQVEGLDRKAMMDAVDKLKNQLSEAVVLLAAEESGKLALIAGVTKSISKRFPAGELMKEVAVIVDGKGGGRPDMAQGGGSDLTKLDEALARVQVWVGNRV
jgi:alanyl-tRNA synthetase